MVNGNYVLYGDRPSSDSEIVDDHVHSRNDRKIKRKSHRTANELQHTLKVAQLDNETDSIKYEKTIKEPRLLRYVPTTDVEENFVTEKFETYDLKPTEERPRRYAFTKKPKNPADGSVNYAYSRSSSSCSSPNGNLPTISEHGEQYGTYSVRAITSSKVNDLIPGYENKLDKYFAKPRVVKSFTAKGSHPDSLYRVPADSGVSGNKLAQVLRVLRWPVALLIVCVALGVFVYYLMPDNLEAVSRGNGTYWKPVSAEVALHGQKAGESSVNTAGTNRIGANISEIDFYDAENEKNADLAPVIDSVTNNDPLRKLPIPPVFPTHLTPEVQYGNEKADSEKRSPKLYEDPTVNDSTLKPHITQKPEKPLAIYFNNMNDSTTATTEAITRAETINDFSNYEEKESNKINEDVPVKTHFSTYNEYIVRPPKDYIVEAHKEYAAPAQNDYVIPEEYIVKTERDISKDDFNPRLIYPAQNQDFNSRLPSIDDVHFTSGHSKLFGISVEDAKRMKSTTQSALYNTRVSPTLPTWRDRDDTTTSKYQINSYSEVQCRSTRLALCRGVLPYDLAGVPATVGDVDITTLMPQIDYLVATNCSDRVRHFICALLEPECSPPPYPQKFPCYNLCKAIVDSCDGHIPRELTPVFKCKQYSHQNCVNVKAPCYHREFTCGDGSCIPQDWLCDGRNDCPAGEDEQKCFQCDESEFKCPSGGCILKRWQCDGFKDCLKGEDETEAICGPRHVEVPDDRSAEPGEESAGSAPAPVVRRPNKVHSGKRKHTTLHKQGDNENSKELLVTSDSNNGLNLRSFTPSPSRLTPYNHSSMRTSLSPYNRMPKKDEIQQLNRTSSDRNASEEIIEDIEFFEEYEKDGKPGDPEPKFAVPAPRLSAVKHTLPAEPTEKPQIELLDNAKNSFIKDTDGAALLRKASAVRAAECGNGTLCEQAGEEAEPEGKEIPENSTYMEPDVFPSGDFSTGKQNWGRAHASPCPSGELRCVDGLCITLAQLCDGTIDCSDHADEDNCYT